MAPTLLERRLEALEEADKQTAAIEFRERLTAVSDEEIAQCIEEPQAWPRRDRRAVRARHGG